MKHLIAICVASAAFASSALAADLAPRMYTKAPVMSPAYNWTGFYIGGHVGGGWTDEDATLSNTTSPLLLNPLGTVINGNRSGFLGGGQIGYNYQAQNLVFGVGGDFSWTHASETTVTPATLVPGGVTNSQGTTDWYATLTGRLGYAANNFLFYGKGGAAWINEKASGNATALGATLISNTVTDTRSGWTVGGGIEWAFWNKWSAFVEYDYLGFDNRGQTFTLTPGGFTETNTVSTNVSMVKAGLNYHLN
jgi:outer membrane immunogenic protein